MSSAFRIVYAEDNQQDADLTRTHFAQRAPDFEMEIVQTGRACLNRLSEVECDLLLLDHHLPDMDGLDLLRTLIHDGVSVPVVLVTGVGDEELVVRALRMGASYYVPKVGVYLDTLPDLLRGVIEEDRLMRSQGRLDRSQRRILYVEHDTMDIDLTERHFAEVAPQVDLEVVRSCDQALARLEQPPPYDAVLIDLRMPGQSGVDLVREVRRRGLPMPPFIMISGQGDEAAAIASLKLGAADYVTKRSGYLDQLVYTIDRAVAYDRLDRLNVRLQTELAERTRIEQALRRSEADHRGLIEHAPLGIYRATLDWRLLTVNPALVEMLGYASAEEVLGLSLPRSVYADPETHALLEAQLEQHDAARAESQWKCRDGSVITVRLNVRTVRGPPGEIECFEGLVEDVTDQRSLESQFRQAQKMEAVGRLAGGVAHDFNNILTVITADADLLLLDLDPSDERRNYVTEIRDAASRATDLTRQLLIFSRKQVVQPRLLNMSEVLRATDKMLQRLIGEDVELVMQLAPDLGMVYADPGQIELVILNLVVNARDAMPAGGRIVLATQQVDLDEDVVPGQADATPGPYVMLAVSDTGFGMDAETQSHIFEPFYTTKELGKGTGLGLATVYGIVKQSGGHLRVYSEPGLGTTFRIYLPQTEGDAEAPTAHPTHTHAAPRGDETVLVAEDDAPVRKAAADVLKKRGYHVLSVPDAESALDLARSFAGKIDLLITDLIMPGMSGRDLTEALASIRPGLPVIFMSGYPDDTLVRQGALDAGTMYLQKPFTAESLARKVREALDTGKDARV